MKKFTRDLVVPTRTERPADFDPEPEIESLAQAHYAHLWKLFGEFLRFRWLSAARQAATVRVDNVAVLAAALSQGKGVLVLTGHFGNFAVAQAFGAQRQTAPVPLRQGSHHGQQALVVLAAHRAIFRIRRRIGADRAAAASYPAATARMTWGPGPASIGIPAAPG